MTAGPKHRNPALEGLAAFGFEPSDMAGVLAKRLKW
jgi:hypothetical protein